MNKMFKLTFYKIYDNNDFCFKHKLSFGSVNTEFFFCCAESKQQKINKIIYFKIYDRDKDNILFCHRHSHEFVTAADKLLYG